jgi:hypothetical protein
MHKADGLTEKERLSDHDDHEASVIRWVLAEDEGFQANARKVAAAEPSERCALAQQLAKRYVPYKGHHQQLIVDLLLLLAEAPWDAVHPAARATFIHQNRPVWGEAPLDELDGRRVRDRSTTLEQGARRLARRGAGKCIHLTCDTDLAQDQFRGRARPTHCSAHLELPRRIRESHRSEIREALDAGTGQRRHRRAARRVS